MLIVIAQECPYNRGCLTQQAVTAGTDITHLRATKSIISPTREDYDTMSTPFILRRSVATISQTALRASSRQTAILPATPVFQRRRLSAASRALGSSQKRSATAAVDSNSFQNQSSRTAVAFRSQVRLYSNDSGPSLRQWGFEDVRLSSIPTQITLPQPQTN